MKKAIVSSVIIVTFFLYAIFRNKNKNNIDMLLPVTSDVVYSNSTSVKQNSSKYKDGEYMGISADAYYGYIQVKAVIKDGKLTDIKFLQYPDGHRRSIEINTMAMPYLKQEAITAQSANVDVVSGATDTTKAFMQSLSSALLKAQS